MKLFKFILVLMLFCFLTNFASADVLPTYTSTVPKNIYGFLPVPKEFVVHSKPADSAPVIEKVKWENTQVYFQKEKHDPTEVFAVFVPKNKYAFLFVFDEQDGWYQVMYDKKHNKAGWIKAAPEDFWSLKDFYTYFGKKKSLYYLKDVDIQRRSLRSGPSDTAQALQGFNVTKNIKLVIIRGNWALVSIIDYEGTVPKTGFIKWRDADGSLLLFPKMD